MLPPRGIGHKRWVASTLFFSFITLVELVFCVRGDSGNLSTRNDDTQLAIDTAHKDYQAYLLYNECVTADNQRQVELAEQCYMEALKLKPDLLEAMNNLAGLYRRESSYGNAQRLYEEVLRVATDQGNLRLKIASKNNLGLLALQRSTGGKENILNDPNTVREVTIPYYLSAIEDDPTFIDAIYNLGNAYSILGEPASAYDQYMRVLELDPHHISANMNVGNIFIRLNRFSQAAAYHERAANAANALGASAQLQTDTLNNLGQTLREMGDLYGAITAHEKALQLIPTASDALLFTIVAKRALCQWQNWDKLHVSLTELWTQQLTPQSTPYDSLLFPPHLLRGAVTPAKISRAFVVTATDVTRSKENSAAKGSIVRQIKQKSFPLNLGYVSYDMDNHPMAFLMHGLYKNHNRSQFGVFVFMYGPRKNSWQRTRLVEAVDTFYDVSAAATDAFVNAMQESNINICVDLMGHTRGAKPEIMSLAGPALYVNFLGYPGTSGFRDENTFIIVDRHVLPLENIVAEITERPIYLPSTYQANDYNSTNALCQSFLESERSYLGCRDAGDVDAQLESLNDTENIQQKIFRFANFNSLHKLEPASFDVWMRILQRVPRSVMLFVEHGDLPEQNTTASLRAEAAARGVSQDRLVFLSRAGKNKHLDRIKKVDLFLDSLVYGAHSTASDVLWAGVPLLTIRGRIFPGRVATSLLESLGIADALSVYSVKEFEDTAVELATHPYRLAAVRMRLSRALVEKDTYDPIIYTQNFENGIRAAVDESWEGREAGAIFILQQNLNVEGTVRNKLLGDKILELINQGRELHYSNPKQAANLYRRALGASTQSVHLDKAIEALHLLGLSEGKPIYIHRAVNLARKLGLKGAFYFKNLAHFVRGQGNVDLARAYFREALDLCIEENNSLEEFTSIFSAAVHLSFLASPQKMTGDAFLLMERIETIFQRLPPQVVSEALFSHLDTMAHALSMNSTEGSYVASYILRRSAEIFPVESEQRALRLYLAATLLPQNELPHEALAMYTSALKAHHAARFKPRMEHRAPKSQRPRVVFYCDEYSQTWWPNWGPRSPENGVGGSEEAVIFLARELAGLGNVVEIYTDPLEEDMGREPHADVYWLPYSAYDVSDPPDVFVSWRYHFSAALGESAPVRLLWLHDMVTSVGKQIALQVQRGIIHSVLMGSRFHISAMPPEVQAASFMLGLGLQNKYFVDGVNNNLDFIYASAPNRGLEELLRIWPQIYDANPQVRLFIYYGFSESFMKWGNQTMPDFESWINHINGTITNLATKGVTYVGMVSHQELALAYARAGFSLYPTSYSETACVSLMKSMAMGAIPITSRFVNSSLPELTKLWDLGPPVREIYSKPISKDTRFLQEYSDSIIAAISQPRHVLADHRAKMKEWARKELIWPAIADRFVNHVQLLKTKFINS